MKADSNKKSVVVDRKFLMRLADKIYNPRTKRWLRLCSGALQKGEDPVTGMPMHCALGELYVAMVPHDAGDRVEMPGCEEDVINMAVELSSLMVKRNAAHRSLRKQIEGLKTSREMKLELLDTINDLSPDVALDATESASLLNFRSALQKLVKMNDKNAPVRDVFCDDKTYRERAKRVATQLRIAAMFL